MRVRKKGLSHSRYAAPRPTLTDMLALEKQFNRTGTDFLKVDLATAFTFVANARNTYDPEKRHRNQKSARRAYDTVLKMSTRVALSDADATELKQNLRQLKSELDEMGEVF